jgi:effector-binding domain-containing protein
MFKNKKTISAITLLSIISIWYLFIKKSDYTITFKAKTSTGTLFQGVNEWAKQNNKNNNTNYKLTQKSCYNFLEYNLKTEKEDIEYSFEINAINDSLSKIAIDIKDNNHSIYNRLTAPFFSTEFKKNQIEKIKQFKTGLEEHLSELKVKSVSNGTTPAVYVAYISLKSVMQEKAQTMIGQDATITGYLHNNNIKIIGKPYLQVTNWDTDKETLEFDYCFPIAKNTKYIENNQVKFREIPAQKGLKVSYYGNYRTSDKGWFAIMDYAKKHDKTLELKPLEHFMANPFNGGTELDWETQIIIPYK